MILKTFLRICTRELDQTLPLLEELTGRAADMRFSLPGLELAVVGSFCVVAGSDEILEPIRSLQGPLIVADLDRAREALLRHGGEVILPEFTSPTGRTLWARHADGSRVEYVEWKPELVERWITHPPC